MATKTNRKRTANAPVSNEQKRAVVIEPESSLRFTRKLHSESGRRGPSRDNDSDCCFTWIRFKKLYPGNLTVKLITPDRRTIERKFSTAKPIRTAFIKSQGGGDDDDDTKAVVGGLGRCVDVHISLINTAFAQTETAEYDFKLCCNERQVRKGARLTHKELPSTPQGQVTALPLLEIDEVKRGACP